MKNKEKICKICTLYKQVKELQRQLLEVCTLHLIEAKSKFLIDFGPSSILISSFDLNQRL